MIKFDLHIHSSASSYKEERNIVDNSTIEKAELLLGKLNANEVALFSITDHNRFNVELYCRLDELMQLQDGKYSVVQGLVAGVEFDVRIDDNMGKCHIITIFDAKNKKDNYKKIENTIKKNLLQDVKGAYSRTEYENLIKEIGLNVILIACQRNGLDRKDGHHNSLSESTANPEELIMMGYIDALEFQKPNVEGILKNNLHSMPKKIGLVMGSDCHEWEEYPYHDKNSKNLSFTHSRASILPTFKGLLMAFTSPESRINRQENRNPHFIKQMVINGETIPLINGVNVIIGENGAGKSTILKMLGKKDKERFVKEIINRNSMNASWVDASYIQYVGQGDIINRFSEKTLFPDENFQDVDNTGFLEAYNQYANNIKKFINNNIFAKETQNLLENKSIFYDDIVESTNYFVEIKVEVDYEKIDNPHLEQDRTFKKMLDSIQRVKNNSYYDEYEEYLNQMFAAAKRIYETIHARNEKKKTEAKVKNFIVSACNDYRIKINQAASSRENDKQDFERKKQEFTGLIAKAVRLNSKEPIFPETPKPIEGISSEKKGGFKFNAEAKYNGRNVENEFLEKTFVKEYSTIETIKTINTKEKFKNAIKNCTEISQINSQYEKNLHTFLDAQVNCKRYIVDSSNKNLGNTLGEMSLAYFNYMTTYNENCSVYLIDQPEDNISNNNISQKMLPYFNSLRYKKQIIIVTHNPLLVVNQDADQVVFVKKINDKLHVVSGCLEKEGNDFNMLDIIADNMDGGRNSIEKRLKVYGKENSVGYES